MAALAEVGDMLAVLRPPNWAARRGRILNGLGRRLGATRPRGEASAAISPSTAAEIRRRLAALSPWRLFAAALLRPALVGGGAICALVLLLSAFIPPVRHWAFPPNLALGAHWKASSAFPGTPAEGTYQGPSKEQSFFVHTTLEHDPWIEFDLGKPVAIEKIVVANRTDCCDTRSLPLNVEIPVAEPNMAGTAVKANNPGKEIMQVTEGWELLCQRRSPFSKLTCKVPPGRKVQKVRISVGNTTYLNLEGVGIYP